MITIQDIAEQADVSMSTVSRALSDSPRISQATRDRIQKLAQDMGYTPNFAAKNLMATESNTVGVVFPPQNQQISGNDFVLHELFGINEQLQSKAYLLATATGNSWREVYESVKMMVEAGKVRRFILLYTAVHDPITQLLNEYHARVVVTGEPQSLQDTLYVDNDNIAAAKAATELLMQAYQLKSPVFVRTTGDWRFEENRETGYHQANPQGQVLTLSENFSEQKQQLHAYFEQVTQVDGIVATDDKLGFLAQKQAEAHLPTHPKLPTIAFNASEYVQLSGRHFYSVDVQPKVLGAAAVELLFSQSTNSEEQNQQHIIVPYRLPQI
ncbi:LacI family DNA-binding transcriptional regulator [Weissella diestrammenae]|uniref:LacI family DNA-binding transcriptional regulator n=2 Tax=Weissella diestrammenae TaxID=1162633 RepID=A0A7G9T7M9_9LACO|nr:LacI family DNA-binding transcriptional regulator [Weissella diestrammenae]QNN76104.1 LacI family DNA-binding transcriptional regulator [Weissella diestrammenae]